MGDLTLFEHDFDVELEMFGAKKTLHCKASYMLEYDNNKPVVTLLRNNYIEYLASHDDLVGNMWGYLEISDEQASMLLADIVADVSPPNIANG